MIVPPMGVSRGMETSNLGNLCTLVASLYKSNCLLPNSVICFGIEVSPGVPHTVVTMNKLEPKKLNYNHRCNYSQQHSYTLDGSWQVIVVLGSILLYHRQPQL